MTWTSPNAPTMTFAGFRSRWITPFGVGVGDRLADLDEVLKELAAIVGGRERRRPSSVGKEVRQRPAP